MSDAAPDASTRDSPAPVPASAGVQPSSPGNEAPPADAVRVRSAVPADQPVIRRLYEDGRAEVGSGGDHADVECLEATYLTDDGASGFWVAEVVETGAVVGMVGARAFDDHRAEIRRLRVAPAWRRRGLGSRLLGAAVDHCRRQGHLKVVLDVPASSSPAIDLFEKAGFALHRERELGERTLIEFYLDLYRDPEMRGSVG